MANEKNYKKIERTTHLEFGGVLGAPFMIVGLPFGVFVLNFMCNKTACSPWALPALPSLAALWEPRMLVLVACWFSWQALLHLVPVGHVVEGQTLNTGKRLKYRMNALHAFVTSVIVLALLAGNGVDLGVVYVKFHALIAATMLFSLALSIFIYIKSLSAPNHALAPGGNSGSVLYDFWIGHELNPRTGGFDWKTFCELRPGLIGWVMIDLCFCAHAHQLYGHVPPGLVLVTFFHALYVGDALWNEPALLTTMDVIHDGFGYMLVFGDLVWVPFMYTLTARFQLEHPQQWGPLGLAGIFALNLVGYYIFRVSNLEKNNFRNNPNDPKFKHYKTISTASGRKLLASGWWGVCRHPNYLGDLIMSLSWSLVCGAHLLPYFYPIYFLFLLIHRFYRDDHQCRLKYGQDWDRYCSAVKYKIIPYVY